MAVIAIGMLFILWGVYPYRVAEIKSPAEVITKELRVGDNLQYHLEGTVYNAFEIVEIRRRMTNGVDYTMHETHPPTPEKGKIDTKVMPLFLSVKAPLKGFITPSSLSFSPIPAKSSWSILL